MTASQSTFRALFLRNYVADLLEVMSPLFCEMDELCHSLDSDEFIDAVGRLYDSVSMPEKNILLLKPDQR